MKSDISYILSREEYCKLPICGILKVAIYESFNSFYKSKLISINDCDKKLNVIVDKIQIDTSGNGPIDEYQIDINWAFTEDSSYMVNQYSLKDNKSVEILCFALNIVKEIIPNPRNVIFNDMSIFRSKIPAGNGIMPLPAFHIAFYDKTWYEYYFNAELFDKEAHNKYRLLIQNMYKKENKPEYINFGNERLEQLLMPLYKSSNNWKEFFQLINSKYHNKCAMIYPWINNAMDEIFENKLYYCWVWKIDLKNINRINYVILNFNEITEEMKIKLNRDFIMQHYDFTNIDSWETMKWDFDDFLCENVQYKQLCGTKRKREDKLP
jgi:hypothetical protein